MATAKKDSKLSAIHKAVCQSMLESLKGEPLLVGEDNRPVLLPDGSPVMVQPKAATLRVICDFLKDNGIDEEEVEGSEIHKVAQAARSFEVDSDPFDLEVK